MCSLTKWSCLCTLLLVIVACHKKEDDGPDNRQYRVYQLYTGDHLTDEYFYDDSGRVTRKHSWVQEGANSYRDVNFYYSYNNKGQLERMKGGYASLPNQLTYYFYDSTGRLAQQKFYNDSTSATPYGVTTYTYGDHTVIQSYNGGSSGYMYTITVDDKGNWTKSVFQDLVLASYTYTDEWFDYDDKVNAGTPTIPAITATNNPRKHTRHTPNVTPDEVDYFEYTYNKAGYVTNYTMRSATFNHTTNYRYVLTPVE